MKFQEWQYNKTEREIKQPHKGSMTTTDFEQQL